MGIKPDDMAWRRKGLTDSKVRTILASEELHVRDAIDYGLRHMESAALTIPFRCEGCGGMILRVPCLACWHGNPRLFQA